MGWLDYHLHRSRMTRPGTDDVADKYEYDFGDGWEHEVTLETIRPRQKGLRYPRCLAGERACPPEDCGGVGGYEDLLAVMRDPTHEEYVSTLRWLGGGFLRTLPEGPNERGARAECAPTSHENVE